MMSFLCAILTSMIAFGRYASQRRSGALSVFRMAKEEFCLSDVYLLGGSTSQFCVRKSWSD